MKNILLTGLTDKLSNLNTNGGDLSENERQKDTLGNNSMSQSNNIHFTSCKKVVFSYTFLIWFLPCSFVFIRNMCTFVLELCTFMICLYYEWTNCKFLRTVLKSTKFQSSRSNGFIWNYFIFELCEIIQAFHKNVRVLLIDSFIHGVDKFCEYCSIHLSQV